MTTKKTRMVRPFPTTTDIVERLTAQDTVLEKLTQKLDDAHVMNGGFDTLMGKVSEIKTVQEQLGKCQTATSEKVTAIHVAIYDPEQGIYAKVKGAIAWIKTANWVIKGVAVAVATGAAGGFCKLAYDLISGNLLIHYAH
jgi:hypothetical protein